MPVTSSAHLEILRRVLAGQPVGGGDIPPPSFSDQIAVLVQLGLIQLVGSCPFRLTLSGFAIMGPVASFQGGKRIGQ